MRDTKTQQIQMRENKMKKQVTVFSKLSVDEIKNMKPKDIRESRRLETNLKIEKLRKDGYRVHIRHDRVYKSAIIPVAQVPEVLTDIKAKNHVDNLYVKTEVLSQNGGDTFIEIESPTGMKFRGHAHCTRHDRFNKTEGILLAFTRAMKEYNKVMKPVKKQKQAPLIKSSKKK